MRLLAAARRADTMGDPLRATSLLREALELLPAGEPDHAAAMAEMLAILVFAFSTNYALSFGLLIVVGGAAVLTQSLTNTKIQLSAPNDIRGRVMGAYTFGTQGMRVLNGPLLGGAAIVFGAPVAVAGAAAVVFAGLAAILARVPQLKQDR